MAITGIGTNGMNPNTQAAPQQRQGLLGGFFGPDGRDARARLAIGLEGLTLNPNQGLIGQLQSGIERRETAAQKNATAEWLRSRGMNDLVALFEAGASAQDVLGEATRRMQPADPMAAINLEKAQLELKNLQTPQPGFRRATTEEAAAYGAQAGQFGPDGRFYAEDVAQPEETGRVLDAATLRQMYPGATIEEGLYNLKPDGTMTKVGGGGTNITMPGAAAIGTIPPGYEVIKDASGNNLLRLIPGGPAANEADLIANQNASLAAAAGDSIALIDNVLNDPNLGAVTGMIQGRLPPVTQAGTDLVSKIDQMQGQAFLQAFQSLKGGGAITEREGQAALNAVARLQRTQSAEAFQASLQELRTIIDRGKRRLEGQNIAESSGIEVGEPY